MIQEVVKHKAYLKGRDLEKVAGAPRGIRGGYNTGYKGWKAALIYKLANYLGNLEWAEVSLNTLDYKPGGKQNQKLLTASLFSFEKTLSPWRKWRMNTFHIARSRIIANVG